MFVRFDLSENIIKALIEITSALRHRSDPPGQALRDTHVPDATIFAIYTFHNLRCRNLQISHSVDLAISRFHNLEISESPDCKSQIAIFGICTDTQLALDDVRTRCRMCLSHGTPESQDVPHETCNGMCHTQCHGSVPHDTCHTT